MISSSPTPSTLSEVRAAISRSFSAARISRAPPPASCWPTARSSTARGFGATGETVAELCFNTAMTGYQEIMTDPSYAGQIVTFTFPHVGNVGTNAEDDETPIPSPPGWWSSGTRPSPRTGAPPSG
jgi:carbamoyl-phosphate synthase small subunit